MEILAHWKNVKVKRSSTVEQEIFLISDMELSTNMKFF